eukprot:1099123-Pyramimonas_sp.AAC.1
MGSAAYTASKSTATSLYSGAKHTGLLSHPPRRKKPVKDAPKDAAKAAKGGSYAGWGLNYFRAKDPHAWDDSIFNATKALTGSKEYTQYTQYTQYMSGSVGCPPRLYVSSPRAERGTASGGWRGEGASGRAAWRRRGG